MVLETFYVNQIIKASVSDMNANVDRQVNIFVYGVWCVCVCVCVCVCGVGGGGYIYLQYHNICFKYF